MKPSSSWFCFFQCLLLSINICISSAFFFTSTPVGYTVSYSDHCSSIVPESTPTFHVTNHSLPHFVTSYFTGGDKLLTKKAPNKNQSYYYVGKSLEFPISPWYYKTQLEGVYQVEAYLYIRSPHRYYKRAPMKSSSGGSYYNRSRTHWSSMTRSLLSGFWSENTRKLCMVGSASWEYDEAKSINLDVVLKLNYASDDNPTIFTSVVSGTFQSTTSVVDDLDYFEPISIFSFPLLHNYNYSLVSKALDGGYFGYSEVPKNQSLSLQANRFCPMFSGRFASFELEYAAGCKKTAQNCSPFGGVDKFLPRFVSLNPIQCSEDDRKLRYIVTFQNTSYGAFYRTFGLNSSLIGEATWDDSNNQLFIIACQILDPSHHLGSAVGDCTVSLSLRYPSIWNIRNDVKVAGQIWSNRSLDDSGFFRKIKFTSADENDVVAPSDDLRYEYTELDRASKLCPSEKLVKKRGHTYPDGHSYDMRFHLSVKNAEGQKLAWGLAVPISVGNELYQGNQVLDGVESSMSPIKSGSAPLNISYKIITIPSPEIKNSNLFPTINLSMNLQGQVDITAEGVYDAETGHLCMIGCRKLRSTNDSTDCEVLVNIEFASLNDKRGGRIKGTIRSTRSKSDTLYFDVMSFSSAAFYEVVARRSIWRMDLETTMVLISNTLVCIFVGLQLLHLQRNPKVLPSISLVMLLILSLGHLIPLVLNYKAVFLGITIKLEAREAASRVVTMMAFLLQARLLQLIWTEKASEGLWFGEKETVLISLPMYIFGGLVTLMLNQTRNSCSLLGDFGSYAGLILDGFLLPQILLNAFRGSSEKALSGGFYIGTSMVRLVPHAYDQYRARSYPMFHVKGTYYYANHKADFFSTAWDIIIPCVIIAMALIIFLQQRYGGPCILPKRFRRLEA